MSFVNCRGNHMIRVQTSAALKTSAEIRGFRSLKHPVGPHLGALDLGRLAQGRARRAARMDWRAWRLAMGR
jgi:hypothetical protein